MQAIRNGLKSAVRTPGKTLLFVLILTVTAALLTVSCCVFSAVRGYLDDCDDYYHTIAELEYIGQYYPDPVIYDRVFADTVTANRDKLSDLIVSSPVISWEPASAELALSPLAHRKDVNTPRANAAVLRIRIHNYDEHLGLYIALVEECLYSRLDYTNKMILVRPMDGAEHPEMDRMYLMPGEFYVGRSAFACFQPEAVSFRMGEEEVVLSPLLVDTSDPGAEEPFQNYAEALRRVNNAFRVTYTSALEDLYPIHEQVMTLIGGRYFTAEEYIEKARACVVSERVSGLLGLTVGDRIPLSVLRADGDLYDISTHTQIDGGDYEVVGIVSHDDRYPFWVFLPDAQAAGVIVRPVIGYTLGQFRLRNDSVQAFMEQAAPLMELGFRLDVYDQGYSAATSPMEELLLISGIFLAVCLLLAACALGLYSYIFILRQRDSGRTMLALGSGRLHVCLYFLSAAFAMAIPGVLFGALIGRGAENTVFAMLRHYVTQLAGQDLRFSAIRLSVVRTLSFAPLSSRTPYLSATGILTGGTLIFTLCFALACLREKKTYGKKTAGRKARTRPVRNVPVSGYFKYAVLSVFRSRGRTAAVLLLGLAAGLFYGQLTDSLSGYYEQMAAFQSNAVISGSATDYYGKRIDGILIDGGSVSRLAVSGLVKDCCVTSDLGHIKILGVEGGEQIPYTWPEYGTFSYESAIFELIHEPSWTGTSSIKKSPPFHYSGAGSVEWLEGWSETDFIRLEQVPNGEDPDGPYRWSGPAVCALPVSMMEEYGIRLGDTINTAIEFEHPAYGDVMKSLRLQVVAAYESPVVCTDVFSPVTFMDRDWYYKTRFVSPDSDTPLAEYQALGLSSDLNYSSFTFSLTDNERLDELRTVMEESGFTWVHSGVRLRSLAVIEDEAYLNTTHSMERQIQFVSVLYDALYVFAGVIGFVLAWLLVHSRRREIAVMRALGTQPGRIVANYVLEQLVLMAAGLGIGIAASRLAGGDVSRKQLLLSAAFGGIWTLSTLISLLAGLRKQSFTALTEPE